MTKNIFSVIILLALIIVIGALFFLTRGPEKESLNIERDLTPIELSEEEKRALQDAGLTIPSGEDTLAKDLQTVRSSDELGAIEADLNETDLSRLDAELEAIESDLSGL